MVGLSLDVTFSRISGVMEECKGDNCRAKNTSKAEACGLGYDPNLGKGHVIFRLKFLIELFLIELSWRGLIYDYFPLTIPGWTRLSLT